MITNERQYKITKTQSEKFKDALGRFSELDLVQQGIDPVIIAAQRSSLEHQLADLQTDLARYEKLRSGGVNQLFVKNISDIGVKLIEARIVQGLSQKELGERLGMKEQQIQRYEQEKYRTANLLRCAEIADALGIDLNAQLEIRQPDLFNFPGSEEREDQIIFDTAKLPMKEIKKRGWLEDIRFLNSGDRSDHDLASIFIRQASRGTQMLALHKQQIRAGSQQDQYALLAWKARVLWKARRLNIIHHRSALDISVVRKLAELSEHTDGPQRAVALLRERGVAVVFEEHLQKTHLDGASMLLDDAVPVIGMTLRADRLDSFWFVLLHECAHILLHADRGLRDGFFDDESAPPMAEIEQEADEYARNALISSEIWQNSFVRFTSSKEQLIQFANIHKVGVAVVAGRIRRERNDYRLFSDLVGQGSVKKLISAAGYWEQ